MPLLFLLALFITPNSHSKINPMDKTLFVEMNKVLKKAIFDIRYYSEDNFLGVVVDGYKAPKCFLEKNTAKNLELVQNELEAFGMTLKIFDCYRPQVAVDHFVRWAKDINDTKTKQKYYPNIKKSELFDLGYISDKSGHTRGSTIDLTIVNMDNLEELDMGSGWDFLDTLSNTRDARPTLAQKKNRLLLKSLMEKYGFHNYSKEWWHFSLKNETYPKTYFNFPVF